MGSKNAGFAIQDGQTIVFIGDSITDCSRRNEHMPLGNGYVRMAIDLITARYPQLSIRYYNRGINGNTCVDLRDRWDDDLISLKPDWVSVMVGINDLHRFRAEDPAMHVPPEKYRAAYENILTRTAQKTSAKLVLLDPFYVSASTNQHSLRTEILSRLGDYISVVTDMAEKFDAIHVPLHAIFQQHLQYRTADAFGPEPVHPDTAGHMVIAHAWLEAMGW